MRARRVSRRQSYLWAGASHVMKQEGAEPNWYNLKVSGPILSFFVFTHLLLPLATTCAGVRFEASCTILSPPRFASWYRTADLPLYGHFGLGVLNLIEIYSEAIWRSKIVFGGPPSNIWTESIVATRLVYFFKWSLIQWTLYCEEKIDLIVYNNLYNAKRHSTG